MRPGLNVLLLILLIAAAMSPGGCCAFRLVFACGLVGFALVAVAFGGVPSGWLLRIPFLANIGHIDDVFITASVPLLLVVASWGASVLIKWLLPQDGGQRSDRARRCLVELDRSSR